MSRRRDDEDALYKATVSELASKIQGPWGQKLIEIFGANTKVCEVVARYNASAYYIDKALRRLYEGPSFGRF